MSTSIKTIKGRYELPVSDGTFNPKYGESQIHLNTFYGGSKNGKMLQITIGNNDIPFLAPSHVQLTQKQVKSLVKAIKKAFPK